MKAYRLYGIGDLRLVEIPCQVQKQNEVLVQVKAAGICGSDIPRIYQTGTYHYPTIPGHEFAGVVEAVGENVDPEWKGKRVGIFPLIPCHACAPCRAGQYEMCRNYGYLGSRQDGGFAEYAVVPVKNLIELPESVSFEEAAMLEPMSVAVHAMRRIGAHKENRIVICGLGTIGLFVLMFLKESGYKNIYAIGNKEIQRRIAVKFGLSDEAYCDSKTQAVDQWILERTGKMGADVFFECVGKNETLLQAINLTAPAGRIMTVGNPASDMKLPKMVYWKILRNQLTVMGTWNSSFLQHEQDDWHYVLERLKNGQIAPGELISHRFALEELTEGLELMRDKRQEYVKVMLGMTL